MDHLTQKDRSSLMGKIKGKNTKPEMVIRRLLHAAGFRYRLHDKCLPGTPDLVFKRLKKAIFINGCFWHAHSCRKTPIPKTNSAFWINKFDRNKKRDSENLEKLKIMGWQILTIWECEVNGNEFLIKIIEFLNN